MKIVLRITLFTALVILMSSLLFTSEKKSDAKKERPLYPNEWMYSQRAYPNGINQKAVNRAWKQRNALLKSENGKTAGFWEQEGPLNIGGRVTDIAISPLDDNTFYIGTAVGGVFKTVDRGESWTPVFDFAGRPSIGNIAIAPSDAQRVYVGTGEANGSGTSGAFFGDGIWRSDDGGDSWSNIGLPESNHIGRIVVDPINPDRVFAATTGILYGTSNTRGLYRTEDGGASWEQVLFLTDSTACIDVVMNPINTDILFAATWERRRRPWGRNYGGLTSKVYRSIDGGDSWEQMTNGLPADSEQTGRIGLSISATDPNIVYASYTTNAVTNIYEGLYRSTNSGDSWELAEYDAISDVNSSFGWYFGNIRVNPYDAEDIHVLGQKLYRSTDNNNSWSEDFQMHVDHHAMEWSSQNPDMILCGNDGGLYISEDNGQNWNHFENLPITQFYQIEVDYSFPDEIYGGTQDNNTIRTLTGSLDDFAPILGGDGFYVNVDPTDNNFVYAEYQFGNLFRSSDNGNDMDYAISDIDGNDRTNWNTPVLLSPYDPEILYYGANRLWKSEDRAFNWEVISGDLTQGQHPSGSGSYGTLTSLAASANSPGVIYTGSDDGMVYVTFNDGQEWELLSNDLPDRYVTGIAIHPEDDLTAYVTYSGYRNAEYIPHVYKTVNGGQSWTDVSGNLPDIPVNDIIIQAAPFRIYVATDMGVWYTENDGENWDILGDNLPPTIMSQLELHEPTNTIYIGTFGRSIYSFDLAQIDATSIHEFEKPRTKIFPNPTADLIEISGLSKDKAEYLIIDGLGKVMRSGVIIHIGQQIDVSNLDVGMYTLRITQNGEVKASRFQIIR